MTTMEELREQILSIDEQLLDLVAKRVDVARQIGVLKQDDQLPVQNFSVEKNVLEHALAYATAKDVDADTTQRIVEALIRAALGAQERSRIRSQSGDGKRALVVGGAGLMGTWFARFLEEQGFHVSVQDTAAHDRPVGDLARESYDVVVVATPPSAVAKVLAQVAEHQPPSTLVFDIASIKGDVRQALEAFAKQGGRVASLHPMFGPSTQLLTGENLLLMDCGNPEALDQAEALFAETTVARHRVSLGDHDAIMAEVLGLAHAVNIVFNETLGTGQWRYPELSPLASTTFKKQVAVARQLAGENPDLYFEIQTLGGATGATIERFAQTLERFREVIGQGDRSAFRAWMKRASDYYAEDAA